MTQLPQLTSDQLQSLGAHALHKIACSAVGTLTTYRLILGRCLLAMQRSENFREFGCSGAVHYAVSRLGLADWQAREHLRMARKLEALPQMTRAVELGWLCWSKLREVIRVATPEDEGQWLQICRKFNYHEVERLVRGAGLPDSNQPVVTELKLHLSPELRQIFERTLQFACQTEGQVVTPAQLLELLCVDYLGRNLDPQADTAAQAENDRALECSARDEIWAAGTACQEEAVPGEESLALVKPAPPHWQNERLSFNPEARLATPAQRSELLRRDGYRCKTPGCPNHLFLQVHHIKFYSEQGATVPENLVCLCSKCHRQVHEGHLRIVGEAPHQLRFLDRAGRDLRWQSELELAQWLDFFVGWRGVEQDGFEMRLQSGRWNLAA